MIEIAQIQYVIAASNCGSFRRAADRFGVRQSSISRGIRALEDELGVSLFERSRTGVRLTNAGEQFIADARPALEKLELAQKEAVAAGRGERGAVRIGILTSLAEGFLRQLIRAYGQQYPEIVLDIRDGCRDEHVAAIRKRTLDLAFVTGDPDIAGCETSTLWDERVNVALSIDHRLAHRSHIDWPDLRDEQFIVSRFAPGPEVCVYIRSRGPECDVQPDIAHKAVTQETLMNLVALGHGITLIAAPWAAVRLPDLVLRPLADPADFVSFSAVWSPQNDNPALRRFISVAHMLAGRVRRGSSDWSREALGLTPIAPGFSADGRRPDRSP